MKFFTRDLYQWLQDSQPEFEASENLTAREAEAAWEEACVASGQMAAREAWDDACIASCAHFDSIKSLLNEDAKVLAHTTFHDGRVKQVDYDGQTLQIAIDTRHAVSELIGDVTLTFHEVVSISGLSELQNADWYYEEIDTHAKAAFEYRVLFHKGEFSVAASRVEIRHIP
ncbi:MAG: DUF4085 family protein [Capsulimonas sp.]|uniref:DUF4085 family protein n=1 Tax=Capsulimonas sp. TaxID=2494211 RepID=UPI003265AD13